MVGLERKQTFLTVGRDGILLAILLGLVALWINQEYVVKLNSRITPVGANQLSVANFASPVLAEALLLRSVCELTQMGFAVNLHPNLYAAELRIAEGLISGRAQGLTVDGAAVGMSYSEVLAKLGQPDSIHWNEPETTFNYSTPDKNQASKVHFVKERVVACFGIDLRRNGEKLSLTNLGLRDSLDYGYTGRLCPTLGIVTGEHETLIGLRDMSYPLTWSNTISGEVLADLGALTAYDPWFQGVQKSWSVGKVSLGEKSTQTHADAILHGGYIFGFRNPKSLTIFQNLSHHAYQTEISIEAEPILEAGYAFLPSVQEGWQQIDQFTNIRFRAGKVVEIQVGVEDSALIEALENSRKTLISD